MKILWVRYQLLNHLLLTLGVAFLALPLWMVFASSTHDPATIIRDGMQLGLSDQFFETYLGVRLQEHRSRRQADDPFTDTHGHAEERNLQQQRVISN